MFCKKIKLFDGIAVSVAALSALQAVAQNPNPPGQLAPVTVTGAAVTAIPQSAASSVTVVSGEQVQPGQITSTLDLTAQTPNLAVFGGNDQRSPRFSFRGFRENNFGVGAPVVGIYVDDVPYFDLYSRGIPLFDVREMEFESGEQGTKYGLNGVGGVINIVTAPPENQTHGYGQLSYGNYNAQDYRAGISGAIVTNKLFFSINGLDEERDGFVYNNIDHDHPDHAETLALRGVVRWTPSDPWSVTLTVNGGRDNDGFVPTYEPGYDKGPFDVSRTFNGYVHTDNLDEALRIGYQNDDVKVTSILSHRQWDQNLLQELPPDPAFMIPESLGFQSPQLNQWTEELRAESPDPTAAFKWRVGGFFLNSDQPNDSGSIFSVPYPGGSITAVNPTLSDYQSQTLALFGQGTYTLWDKLDLTAGVRLSYDYRKMTRTDYYTPFLGTNNYHGDLSGEFTSADPKFAVGWHFTPTLEVYASATSGYQSGGFNPYEDNPSLSQFSPERDWQFEVGAKSSWLDNKISANAALFYTVADNYQTYRTDPTDPFEAYMLNAKRADLYGAQLQLTARPIQGLDLSAGVGYTDARYSRFTEPAAASPTGMAPVDLDGKAISFVPEFTANGTALYRLPWWHLYVRGEIIGVGRYHLDDSYDPYVSGPTTQDAYCLVNAEAGYEGKNFAVYFFANNIFDKRYYNNALNLGYSSLLLQPGNPATYGFTASARF